MRQNSPGKRLFPVAFCVQCRAYFLCCVARGDRDMRRLVTVTDRLGPSMTLVESKLVFWRGGKGSLEGTGNHPLVEFLHCQALR